MSRRPEGFDRVFFELSLMPMPAMSVMFADRRGAFSGYSVIFAELDPDDPGDATPTTVVCLHCLIEDGDAQLARGIDLARAHGQVDFNPDGGEWFVRAREGPSCGAGCRRPRAGTGGEQPASAAYG